MAWGLSTRTYQWRLCNKNFYCLLVSWFGVPHYVTTDRGTQFVSATMKILAKRFGFTLCPTTSWHLAANGLVERMHRQLKAAIMSHASESWTESLPSSYWVCGPPSRKFEKRHLLTSFTANTFVILASSWYLVRNVLQTSSIC